MCTSCAAERPIAASSGTQGTGSDKFGAFVLACARARNTASYRPTGEDSGKTGNLTARSISTRNRRHVYSTYERNGDTSNPTARSNSAFSRRYGASEQQSMASRMPKSPHAHHRSPRREPATKHQQHDGDKAEHDFGAYLVACARARNSTNSNSQVDPSSAGKELAISTSQADSSSSGKEPAVGYHGIRSCLSIL